MPEPLAELAGVGQKFRPATWLVQEVLPQLSSSGMAYTQLTRIGIHEDFISSGQEALWKGRRRQLSFSL